MNPRAAFWEDKEKPIRELGVAAGVLALFVVYLLVERVFLHKSLQSVPLRICVTGTRGKSSVTRLIAAALRDSGMSVLSRTTGAKPVLLLPDGGEEEIVRRGIPTILEGKKLLRMATKLTVNAVVVELMGFHPETIHVESTQIFKAHILVLTNVRFDHLAQMGHTKDTIASTFAGAIPRGSTVFIHQDQNYSAFQKAAEAMNAKILWVKGRALTESKDEKDGCLSSEFDENIRLSLAVVEFLGKDTRIAFKAMSRMRPDFGSLKVWTDLKNPPLLGWYFVSGFAANEPESTQLILSKLRTQRLLEGKKIIALLNLRGDRGDRTLQWLDAIKGGIFPGIQRFVLVGDHTLAMRRRLKKCADIETYAWPGSQPEEVLVRLSIIEKEETVVIGMGNMGGAGERFVDYWEKTGQRYDL
jgi:poly-gamma-glutamate synthase PgsB/CapB